MLDEYSFLLANSTLCCICKILNADASLRPYLETYERKHAKTMNDINLRKLQKVAPSKTTDSSGENDGKRKAGNDNKDDDEEEKAEEDENDGAVEDDDDDRLLCATCNPPSTSK